MHLDVSPYENLLKLHLISIFWQISFEEIFFFFFKEENLKKSWNQFILCTFLGKFLDDDKSRQNPGWMIGICRSWNFDAFQIIYQCITIMWMFRQAQDLEVFIILDHHYLSPMETLEGILRFWKSGSLFCSSGRQRLS